MDDKQTTAEHRIPKELEGLFWSYHTPSLDVYKDQRVIMMQTLNYGTWAQWQWLSRTYGKEAIKNMLSVLSPTAIRPPARSLASLIFGLK